MIRIIAFIIIIILILIYINYAKLRYKWMVVVTKLRVKFKNNENIIYLNLNRINNKIEELLYLLNSDIFIKELLNKIPIHLVHIFQNVLEFIHKIISYILKQK